MFKRKRKKLFVFFRNFFQNQLVIDKLSSVSFCARKRASIFFFAFLTADDGSIVSLAHFLRKISAEHVARAGGKKDAGGEFDSLSAPPPVVPRLQPHAP